MTLSRAARAARLGLRPIWTASIVSTVVPQLAPEYARDVRALHRAETCLIVGPSVKTGMPIRIDNPHELGADRLVNAVAAYDRVGGACVAVDFGTSINFDAVSDAGEYLGGVIAPGRRDLDGGADRARPRSCRGSTSPSRAPRSARTPRTRSSRASSTGSPGLVDGISRRLAPSWAASRRSSRPGAWRSAIVPFCETIDEVDDLLTLTGLRLIYERNR